MYVAFLSFKKAKVLEQLIFKEVKLQSFLKNEAFDFLLIPILPSSETEYAI